MIKFKVVLSATAVATPDLVPIIEESYYKHCGR
jgi:hypothetical protein